MKYRINTLKTRGFRRWLAVGGASLGGLLIVGWLAVNNWYNHSLRPLTNDSNPKVVVIELGSSTSQIAQQLEDKPLIRSARAFSWYVSRLDDNGVIQAGTYRLDSNMTVAEIVDILVTGRVDTSLVTIVGGLRLDEIKQVLVNAGFDAMDVSQAINSTANHPITDYWPAGANLEGYIFPETYQITANSSPKSIINQALDTLYEQITPSLLAKLQRQKLSLHQAVILASIIQEESSGPEDQPKVAQVFLKRLKLGMPLGADATFRYAAAITGQDATPGLDSPYNTRLYDSLPPGPIANFEISALLAVADPAATDYLYFLHGDDCLEPNGTCTTYFANTQAEHEANAAKYCRQNCQLEP